MKVLMVTRDFPPYLVGGMGIFVKNMAELLPKMGVKLTIVGPLKNTKQRYEKINDNLEIYRVPTYGKTFLTKVPTLAYFAGKLARGLDYDLAHLLTPCFTHFKCPTIVNFQSTRYGEYKALVKDKAYVAGWLNTLYIPLEKNMAENADIILVLTEKMKEEILKFCHVDKQKIQVLPNGVDLTRFKPQKKKKRNNIKKILYVGRLDLRKRVSDLIQAFKKINNKIKAELVIAGEGALRKNLETLARGYPVRFLGKVPHKNIPCLYQESDLVVVPSSYEGFPLVILEAMASGIPVLTSDSCPNFGNSQFETGNVDDLAEKMTRFLKNEELTKTQTQQGLNTAQKFSWDSTAQQLFGIYQSLIA